MPLLFHEFSRSPKGKGTETFRTWGGENEENRGAIRCSEPALTLKVGCQIGKKRVSGRVENKGGLSDDEKAFQGESPCAVGGVRDGPYRRSIVPDGELSK